ncbi:sec-independent protein translocase protein TatC [Nakamurella panacisegetis]|uniref:Sec-independent protein translocase protein TatC n=1 Tax=Nakamurella panacisegetis TaxID=1090615 RepID=A0A1H0RSW5_9ACTN|nr:twin-arginine translocase subunit TatC [Nakamurella panacisegetis]SDP32533.1 sec-independent protein translocase protein TatC [Nakamurella panacisegetis]
MLLRRKKDEPKPDGTMSLMEHLYELRKRLFWAAVGLFLGTLVGFIWYTVAIPSLHIANLGDILTGPYCKVPADKRLAVTGHACALLATDVFSPLQIRLKAAFMVGAVLSCPVWLYQLWAFVTPALYDKERKFARIFVSFAAVLFAGGAVLAYFVISEGLTVLLGFAGSGVVSGLDPSKYFQFLMAMLIIFGVSFELPLMLIMLNIIGLIKGEKLAKARRYSIFGLVVFAALVVPGNDPITMSALALSLVILYEVAVQVTKVHDKRKGARLAAEGLGDLSDDEASPDPTTAGDHGGTAASPPVERPAPVPAPTPITVNDPSAPDFGDAT